VPAGALDDDAPLEIVAQLFLASRMACDHPRTDGMQFEEAPPMAELIAMLHRGSPGHSSG
jgi:hypothetical protein